jgi:predicted ribosome quality control (RQC) complex YloA/Tae2 family protein
MGTGAERLNRAKYKLRDLSKEIKDLEQELRETERLGKILIQRNKGLDRTRSSVNRQNEATIQSAKYLNLNYRATSEAFVDEGIEELKENSDFE